MTDHGTSDKPVVLYVDDIQANLMLFEASFDDDYEVLLADSGKKGLEILAEREIHVLVSDQNMPGMTGNELLEQVTMEYPDVMRFMITAYTDYETVVEAINKGHLYGFFNKPYNIDDVKHSINNSLEVRSLRIKNREMIEKLEQANEQMKGVDKAKTRFLTSLTNEIRTPVSKIMTAIHMIKDKVDSSELTGLLHDVDLALGRLESFSDAAKQLEKLNDPHFRINGEKISLKEIVEVSVIEKGNTISSKEVQIQFGDSLSGDPVAGEYELVQASFSTLFGFVLEHCEPKAKIQVNIDQLEGNLKIGLFSEDLILSEKEKTDLSKICSSTTSASEDDLRLELLLISEIMKVHSGSMEFDFADSGVNFALAFPV